MLDCAVFQIPSVTADPRSLPPPRSLAVSAVTLPQSHARSAAGRWLPPCSHDDCCPASISRLALASCLLEPLSHSMIAGRRHVECEKPGTQRSEGCAGVSQATAIRPAGMALLPTIDFPVIHACTLSPAVCPALGLIVACCPALVLLLILLIPLSLYTRIVLKPCWMLCASDCCRIAAYALSVSESSVRSIPTEDVRKCFLTFESVFQHIRIKFCEIASTKVFILPSINALCQNISHS
jgi:hypothetical protein